MNKSFWKQFWPVFVLVFVTGCGSDIPELSPVTGRVTRDGQPIADAVVVFTPTKGAASSSRTDAEGNFELVYFNGSKGAVIDVHRVTVTIGNPGKPLQPGDPPRPMLAPPEDVRLPETFTVNRGENSLQLALPPKSKSQSRT